ncbi:cyclic nucleotide-binding domain-containing protein [Nostoc ellipsosporum NOK]|nr:cyclic nucleotide-binding domain-containing protein [Nostoc ellipsosporum NOK]
MEKYLKLSEAEKKIIGELNILKYFVKDAILLEERQRSTDRFFVIKGCIRRYYMINGEEKTTAFYTEGETFVPVSSINNVPSQQFVACAEDSILAVSTPEIEQFSFEKFPRFEKLCRLIGQETCQTADQLR